MYSSFNAIIVKITFKFEPLITHYYAKALPIDESQPLGRQLLVFIASGYVFKAFFALLDTLPLYWLVRWLRGYLQLDEHEEVGTLGRYPG